MLIEKPELKAEIAAWVEARKKAYRDAKKVKDEAEAGAGTGEEEEKSDATHSTSSSLDPGSTRAGFNSSSAAAPAQPAARRSYLDD
jgi:hypothetical protein